MKTAQEVAKWKCKFRLEKRDGDINECKTPEERRRFLEETPPYEVIEREGNVLLTSGVTEIWNLITGVQSGAHRLFSNANARIGVGDSTVPAATTQTDLQAPTNRVYAAQEQGFPVISARAVRFRAAWGNLEANFAWNEWVVRSSAATTPTNICLNRLQEAMGVKVRGTWALEVEISLT